MSKLKDKNNQQQLQAPPKDADDADMDISEDEEGMYGEEFMPLSNLSFKL